VNPHRIHVPLLSNETEYREVDARPAGDGRFRLLGSAKGAEPLKFKAGELVECSILKLPNGSKGLVATRSVSADPEYRSKRTIFAVVGAIVGALFGAVCALSFELSLFAFLVGAMIGAIVFAFCSVRWGDSAWEILSRVVGGRWRD
jgi:uncharacterized membrane protein